MEKRLLRVAAVLVTVATLSAQDPVVERLERLEHENRGLRERLEQVEARTTATEQGVDALGRDAERAQHGDVLAPPGASRYGLGPGASKVYSVTQGLSVGGYGEFLLEEREDAIDRLDALRAVFYVGYKFDEHWVLNTEIEIEHATTDDSSGTTDSHGEVSLEFGYLDYLFDDALNARAGLVLVPVGLVNELHEPTTFLAAQRPEVERRILPTTWRAPGAGVFGDVGGFSYRAYALSALDGERYDASGIRSARQQGNREAADDFAVVGRLDWTGTPGLLVGVSAYWGDTGQDGLDDAGNTVPDLTTTLFDVHADWKPGPFWFRGLFAQAFVDDTAAFHASTGTSVAERMQGFYVEAAFDVVSVLAPDSPQALYPFVRWEEIDTQAGLAHGVPKVAGQDDRILTYGLHWKPIPQVVMKADYQDFRDGADRFDLLLGYVF